MVEWAAQGCSVAFDLDVAVGILSHLAEDPSVQEVLSRRCQRSPLPVHSDNIEMHRLDQADNIRFTVPEGVLKEWVLALLQLDLALAKLRFQIVPSRVKEDRFWARYFQEAALALRHRFGVDNLDVGELERGLHMAYAGDGPQVMRKSSVVDSGLCYDGGFVSDDLVIGA